MKRKRLIAVGLAVAAAIGGVVWRLSLGPTVVPIGGDMQAAINAAACGDTIVVQAGGSYNVNLTLPVKPCADYITIQSSQVAQLPAGVRVGPAQANFMAKFQSAVNAEPVVKTASGAHHYKFIGIEFMTASAAVAVYDLVRFGDSRQAQKTLADAPHHLTIDRSYIHGWPTQDVQRGVSLQCGECSVTNSYISDIHGVGFDTQAVASWNGPGPFHIINNYLEAAGENALFGGADSAIPELMPANLEFRRNYVFKPLSWKVGDPTYAGYHWTVKNLFELKALKGGTVDGNVFENNWTDGQAGVPILFTVRNQECTANWSTVQQVTFTNNTVKNAEGGLNFLGKDNEAEPAFGKCPAGSTSTQGSDVTVSNNLFQNIHGPWLTLNGFYNVTLANNTSQQSSNLMTLYGEMSNGFKFTNHLTNDHDYGIFGDGGFIGTAALAKYAPGFAMTGCVIATPYGGYPAGNQYPATPVTLPPDWRSPYPGVGCDVDVLAAAQSGTNTPSTPTPTATASPTPTVQPQPSPTATATPTATPTPQPSPCQSTSWPNSVNGQNSQMQTRRAEGCYPVQRTNSGMNYAKP